MLFVPHSGDCTIITPLMESEMCRNMTWIEDVRAWTDGAQDEWMRPLRDLTGNRKTLTLGIEQMLIPQLQPSIEMRGLNRVIGRAVPLDAPFSRSRNSRQVIRRLCRQE